MNIKLAVEYYKKAMERGEPYASYRFAMCLIKGKLNKNLQKREDIEKGYKMLEQMVNNSRSFCPEALSELG